MADKPRTFVRASDLEANPAAMRCPRMSRLSISAPMASRASSRFRTRTKSGFTGA